MNSGFVSSPCAAIDSTVKIYLSCLLKLIEEHNYDIYVHPVRRRAGAPLHHERRLPRREIDSVTSAPG